MKGMVRRPNRHSRPTLGLDCGDLVIELFCITRWEEPPPPSDNLLVGPAVGGLRVDPKQDVQVVVQDDESTDSHREDLGQLIEAVFDPRPPITRSFVEEKRAADTAIDAVIPACHGNIDEL
jgi:hypothetical protein